MYTVSFGIVRLIAAVCRSQRAHNDARSLRIKNISGETCIGILIRSRTNEDRKMKIYGKSIIRGEEERTNVDSTLFDGRPINQHVRRKNISTLYRNYTFGRCLIS